jgi:hypothetical protein
MLVAIEPPVIGQPYGPGGEDIYYLLLATRFQGQTLFPISEWPPSVYVARLLNKSIIDQREFDYTQTQLIDWGVLYPTYDDAPSGGERSIFRAKAKSAFQDFLTIWKDGDADIPLLRHAKARPQCAVAHLTSASAEVTAAQVLRKQPRVQ